MLNYRKRTKKKQNSSFYCQIYCKSLFRNLFCDEKFILICRFTYFRPCYYQHYDFLFSRMYIASYANTGNITKLFNVSNVIIRFGFFFLYSKCLCLINDKIHLSHFVSVLSFFLFGMYYYVKRIKRIEYFY